MLRRNLLAASALSSAIGFISSILPSAAQAARNCALDIKPSCARRPAFNMESKTVKLNNGSEMPIHGIGTYSLHGQVCINALKTAIENGVRLIDTAHIYGNEKEVGQAVRECAVPREKLFVITKLYPNQFKNAAAAIDEALKKLDIGYIDMMLLHHPGAGDVDAYKAIEDAVAAGKVRAAGLSNWYIDELKDFLPQVCLMPALVQNEIHPYYQDTDVVEFIANLGIIVQAWYPLGGRGYNRELLSDPVLADIALAHGKSLVQVILRWNLERGVVAIPGSSNPAHIKENTEIFDFELTKAQMERIAALNRNEKHDWY